MIDVLTWVSLLALPFFLVLDLFVRARRYDAPRGWRVRALLVSAFNVALSLEAGAALTTWFGGTPLLDGAALGTALGAVVGILGYELAHYAWHRAAHGVPFLWRHLHQFHHAAESLDAFGANYLHPVDSLVFTAVAGLVLGPVLGLSAEAAAITVAFVTVNAAFQHANLRTPRWLGWFVQRPEAHAVHHGTGVHRFNYADLPLWDMVFGTWRNPRTYEGPVGFFQGASSRVGDLLLGRDLSRSGARAPRRASRADAVAGRAA
ncbi:MAG: sterol desaturase family protein [Planctomycetota bacterium]